MTQSNSVTLPSALASGPAQRVPVMVELTNGVQITGHIVEWDVATLNLKLDMISHTNVRRCATVRITHTNDTINGNNSNINNVNQQYYHNENVNSNNSETKVEVEKITFDENDPVGLRCIHSIVLRGACIRFIDFLPNNTISPTSRNVMTDSNTNLNELITIAQTIRPSFE